ncbi:titin-like [Saccostrea echinata]|uniref:titin-like n=1 Tax=Saccostrea echinata TaxID=191078 RepID=UPI002A83281F|nr:titin-like [Saccostrea echinata]
MAVRKLLSSIFSVIILCFYQCAGELTLSSAKVREGEALELLCQSSEAGGLYTFYSSNNQGYERYGIGVGSFKSCQTGDVPGYIMECDFDNWIFNLTILNPIHNQVIFCNRRTGPEDTIIINTTIFVQVPVKRIMLSPSSKVDVVSGNSLTFTCVTFASRPAAEIVWHINSTTLAGNTSIVSKSGLKYDVNSTLTLTLTKQDNSKEIYCSSNNTFLEKPLKSSKAFLNILYVPSIAPQLKALGSTSVNEGQIITLRCNLPTLGNPPVTWSWNCGDDTLTTEGVNNTGTQTDFTLTVNRKYNQRTCHCRARSTRPSLTYDQISDKQSITVFYVPSFAPQLKALGSTAVNERQNITLRCNLPTLGNPPVAWRWNCGDDTFTTEGVNNTGTQTDLTLTVNRKYNQRTCHCRARTTRPSLSYDQISNKQSIAVFYVPTSPPQLKALGSTAVNERQNITLRCNLPTLGNPPVVWSWNCGDDTFTTEGVNNTGTQTDLTLTVNRKYNQRTCHCRARTTRPSLSYDQISNKQSIAVFYVPVTDPELNASISTSVEEGRSIQLLCKLQTMGNPPIVWSWVCGNVTQTDGVINTGTQSVLTLPASKRNNKLICQCRARSPRLSLSYDRMSKMQRLSVFYISDVQIMPGSSLSIVAGEKLTLISCYVESANPEDILTYKWMKDDGFNTTLVSTSQFYLIELAKVEDSGRYVCTARSSMRNASGIIDVNVQRKPLPPTIIQVVCKTRYAYVSMVSSYLGIQGSEILQYSEMDNLFENATLEVMNKTHRDIIIYKVLSLMPGKEYKFRILAFNLYGITESKSQKCSTDRDAETEFFTHIETPPLPSCGLQV